MFITLSFCWLRTSLMQLGAGTFAGALCLLICCGMLASIWLLPCVAGRLLHGLGSGSRSHDCPDLFGDDGFKSVFKYTRRRTI